jgi:glycosyltransferase involved in cell wall biosynthesis
VSSNGLREVVQNEAVEDELNSKIYYEKKIKSICSYDNLREIEPDIILANDLDCLVITRMLWPNARVVFDAHEYAPEEYNSTDDFWLKNEKPARIWACNNFLLSVSGMTTVCQGIADEFNRNFNIPCNIEIITNSPFFESIPVKGTGSIIKVIHHGIGSPLRKIELMAEAVKELGNGWELHLILVEGDFAYIKNLKKRYKNYVNIYFHDPVPTKLIAKFISQFDIGIFILEPDIFNYKWALPNKFFEFIQARLAIAVGPSPEMARIVNSYGLGIVSPDFSAESMASSLKSLSKIEIDIFKSNSNNAASIYSAEKNRDKMLSVIKNALNNSVGSAS